MTFLMSNQPMQTLVLNHLLKLVAKARQKKPKIAAICVRLRSDYRLSGVVTKLGKLVILCLNQKSRGLKSVYLKCVDRQTFGRYHNRQKLSLPSVKVGCDYQVRNVYLSIGNPINGCYCCQS